ncbi:hypothetical protein [Ramlibacter rhizophilus]|uniref:DUF1190 domain-containing protein n=1 Tax=Ramlibacter rhizophilus TaxID=1781167 RepID=A0A4Z0BT88_9BURK|nr:hypothetical protein [Ramlibacter rhizophilus]TFZ01219.1 hypothetical protein EZ242_07500 [Ramlibacter rhizophilus]
MNRLRLTPKHRGFIAFGATALLAVAATAQVTSSGTMTHREQMAACRSGATYQDRERCMAEVQAAQAARSQGRIDTYGQYAANALARCNIYREQEDVLACRGRVMGLGEITGSVTGGGLLREYEYLVPAPAASEAGQPAGASSSAMGAGAAEPRTQMRPPEPVQPLRPILPLEPAFPMTEGAGVRR